MKITVEQGCIPIESIRVLHKTPDLVVLHVDTRAKYPELSYTGSDCHTDGTTDAVFGLTRNENTIGALPGDKTTTVSVIHPFKVAVDGSHEFRTYTSVGRYYVEIALVRDFPEGQVYEENWP